ncbi:MAG: hypothetical protein KA783_01345 [Chitinophagales bacterium]|jgi:hypothetical protein|nr:hypothetical protein [Chitinophagales bacterium]
MTIYTLYDQVADLIAELNPQKVLALKAPIAMQQHLDDLIEKSQTTALDKDEKDELDHYLVLERLIRLAKIHAQERLLVQ